MPSLVLQMIAFASSENGLPTLAKRDQPDQQISGNYNVCWKPN